MSFDAGMAAFKAGNYNEAARYFAAVTDADDQNHKAWNALGVVLTKTGDYEEADTCYQNALTIDPGNETYQKNREKNLTKWEKDDELEVDDDNPPVQQSKGSTKKSQYTRNTGGYQANWLILPLFLVPIIAFVIFPILGFIVLVICAWYISSDADSLNAGSNPHGSTWGKMKGWEWGLLLFFFWILLPLYFWKREQIFYENQGKESFNVPQKEGMSIGAIIILIIVGFFLLIIFTAFFIGFFSVF
jgi:tetratricopeptide (TPR) repeat protein